MPNLAPWVPWMIAALVAAAVLGLGMLAITNSILWAIAGETGRIYSILRDVNESVMDVQTKLEELEDVVQDIKGEVDVFEKAIQEVQFAVNDVTNAIKTQ